LLGIPLEFCERVTCKPRLSVRPSD